MRRINLKTLVFLIVCFNSSSVIEGQNIDSLYRLMNSEKNPTKKVDLINAIGLAQISKGNKPSLKELDLAIKIARENGHRNGEGLAINNKGIFYILNTEYVKAEEQLLIAKEIFSLEGNSYLHSKALNNLGILYDRMGDYSKSIKMLNLYLEDAESLNDSSSISKAYNNLSNTWKKIGNYQKAIDYLLKGVAIDSVNNDRRGVLIKLSNLTDIYKNKGEFSKAIPIGLKALTEAEKMNDSLLIYWTNTNIGLIFYNLDNDEKSNKHLFEAYNIALKIEDTELIGASLINLSLLYEDINIDSSIIFLEEAQNIFQDRPDELARTLINLGGVYSEKKGNHQKAKKYLNEALNIGIETESKPIASLANHELGVSSYLENNYYEAINYFENSIGLSKKIDDLKLLEKNYRSVSECYFATNQPLKGKENLNKFLAISDSLLTEERATRKVMIDFEVQKQKMLDEIKIQKQADELQIRNITLCALLVCLFFVGVIAYQRYKASKETKEMSAEMHHRTRNNLATLSSILSIKGNQIKGENAKVIIDSIQNRVIVLEKIHSLLYRRKNALETEIKSFLSSLIEEIELLNNWVDNKINLEVEIFGNEFQVEASRAIEIGKVLNEIATNAYKYSSFELEPEIKVKGSIKGAKLTIEVINNGKPLPENFDINKLNSFGLKWVASTCGKMKWNFSAYNLDGKVNFKIDISLK